LVRGTKLRLTPEFVVVVVVVVVAFHGSGTIATGLTKLLLVTFWWARGEALEPHAVPAAARKLLNQCTQRTCQ
jgi:hypothetical protein